MLLLLRHCPQFLATVVLCHWPLGRVITYQSNVNAFDNMPWKWDHYSHGLSATVAKNSVSLRSARLIMLNASLHFARVDVE